MVLKNINKIVEKKIIQRSVRYHFEHIQACPGDLQVIFSILLGDQRSRVKEPRGIFIPGGEASVEKIGGQNTEAAVTRGEPMRGRCVTAPDFKQYFVKPGKDA